MHHSVVSITIILDFQPPTAQYTLLLNSSFQGTYIYPAVLWLRWLKSEARNRFCTCTWFGPIRGPFRSLENHQLHGLHVGTFRWSQTFAKAVLHRGHKMKIWLQSGRERQGERRAGLGSGWVCSALEKVFRPTAECCSSGPGAGSQAAPQAPC